MKTAIKMALGLINSKFFSAPFYVQLYVTDRCNLQCRMCNIWKRKSKEMTINEIEHCAKSLKELKVSNVVITGGEPFLRPDIVEIVRLLNDYGFSIKLQTNGTLVTEEKIKALARAGLRDITISLDTLDEGKYDWICRSKNLFRKVEQSLDLAAKYMKGFVVASTVVSKINVSELPEIIKFVNSKGAYSLICPLHQQPPENDTGFCCAYSKEMILSKGDMPEIEKAYAEVLKMKQEGYRIISSTQYLKASLDYFRTGKYSWHCKAGERFFVIYPDGGVSPCEVYPSFINAESNFTEKFRSAEYKENVRRTREGCSGCIWGCWRETSLFIDDFGTKMEQMMLYLGKKDRNHKDRL
jgi:MoaA/NifB/PqqE/SkfB family radical SAM enzyme